MGDMGAYVSDKACTTPVSSAVLCFSSINKVPLYYKTHKCKWRIK
jgi:hypothetical protein